MKFNIILLCIAIALGYVTCKNFRKTAETPAPATQTAAPAMDQGGPSGWKAAHVLGENADTAGVVQVDRPPARVEVPIDKPGPASASRKAYLSTGWWHLNMAFQGTNSKVHEKLTNKWLRFREDQTFDILIKGQKVDSGRWAWDEDHHQIYLSCNDPYINNTWEVNDKGFVMIWLGNTDLNVSGIQIRVVCSKGEPKWE